MKKGKKILSLILSLAISMSCIISVNAEESIFGSFTERVYDIFFYDTESGYITNVDRSKERADVIIPKQIEGVNIVGIGSVAFSLYPELSTIEIPDTITYIANNAFENSSPIIKCTSGSYAESWAKTHNFPHELIINFTLDINDDQTIAIGNNAAIMATLKLDKGAEVDIDAFQWQSDNENVVKIEPIGEAYPTNNERIYQAMAQVDAISAGSTKITVSYQGVTAECTVTVEDDSKQGFDLARNGWPIVNARESFGYPDGYRIPKSRYTKTFGISLSSLVLGGLQTIPEWGGNCFGLSLLAIAQYNGQIDISDYFPDKNSNQLYTFGYNDIQNISRDNSSGDIFSIAGNEDAIELIECALLSQNSQEIKKAEVFAGDKSYSQLISYLSDYSPNPLLVTLSPGTGGHAMVISTDEKPVRLEQSPDWYYIPLYDCNNPSNSPLLNNPFWFYNQSPSYLLVNTNNGKWQYWRNGSVIYSNDYNFLWDKYIHFYDISKLGNNFFNEALTLFGNLIKIDFSSNDILLTDVNDNVLFKAIDGNIEFIDESCEFKPMFDSDSSENLIGSISLPKNIFRCTIDEGEFAVYSDNSLLSVQTDGKNDIDIDTENCKIKELSNDNNSMIISLQNGIDNQYSAISLIGTTKKNKEISLQLDGDIILTDGNDDGNFDVKTETEQTINNMYKCNIYDLNEKSISQKESNTTTTFNSEVSSWAKEEVEEAYNDGLIPDVLIGEDLTKKIDRAEFAAISVQLYEELTGNIANTNKNPFSDISSNKSKNEILKAYSLGITAGMTDTTFEPDTLITREQLATMLCRTIKKYSFDGWSLERDSEYYLDTSGVPRFADDADISDYAKPSVYYMTKFGIIKGIDDTHFAPKNTTSAQEAAGYAMATREQAIALSLRIFKVSDMWK